MFRFSTDTTNTASPLDEELNGDVDEPPDDLPPLDSTKPFSETESRPTKPPMPAFDRKQSLLTRALMQSPPSMPHDAPRTTNNARGPSSFSTQSTASTAELTSDGDMTSPARTATPSPPLPPTRFPPLNPMEKEVKDSRIVIAPTNTDQLPSTADNQESRVEANLGRKRCVMFACGRKASPPPTKNEDAPPPEQPKRKCMLTFACPTRASKDNQSLAAEVLGKKNEAAHPVSPTLSRTSTQQSMASNEPYSPTAPDAQDHDATGSKVPSDSGDLSPSHSFHEFSSQHDEEDWVREPTEHKRKLTLTDCMMKEMAIRKIGEEAEEEAEEDEENADDADEDDEDENGDDFAPSDNSSDDGNESDDEGGFAESDDESDAGSDYQFWAPSTTTAATSVDNLEQVRPAAFRRRSNTSIESTADEDARRESLKSLRASRRARPIKTHKMRPSTPDLPDSTDFVCGTLDEDRPLEAAYKSCMELKKRAKHVPIPQDIDPSFPTSDPEDAEENDDENHEDEDTEDNIWIKGQLDGFDDDALRGRHRPKAAPGKNSPTYSPKRLRSPPPVKRTISPPLKRPHSPPPPRRLQSPPPRSLFTHSPKRLRSPPPLTKLHSPPGTRQNSATASPAVRAPIGITINRLAQRPNLGRTASLPHTPNPFFRLQRAPGHQTIVSAHESEAENSQHEMHVRGAVDIVIGLEKKRQKRKEKFWRQHCRKAAKEQAEKKPTRGKGVERMRELGLECAERNRGYGLGQQAQHVLSL
ncbi:MAG: hypothetical protein Q9227_007277 [Pyrenula ochraceoflavens]